MPPTHLLAFQYNTSIFSVFCMQFPYFTMSSIYSVCIKPSNFSVFSKIYAYFRINTDKSVYLEAMLYYDIMSLHTVCKIYHTIQGLWQDTMQKLNS